MKSLATLAAVATLSTGAAGAATVEFTATVVTAPFTGFFGTGTLTYDETLVPASGFVELAPNGSTSSGVIIDPTLAIFVDTGEGFFTRENDANWPDFPRFDFVDGILVAVDYILIAGVNGVDFGESSVLEAFFDTLVLNADGSASIDVELELTPIPLPAGLPLLLTGLAAFGLARRRRG